MVPQIPNHKFCTWCEYEKLGMCTETSLVSPSFKIPIKVRVVVKGNTFTVLGLGRVYDIMIFLV